MCRTAFSRSRFPSAPERLGGIAIAPLPIHAELKERSEPLQFLDGGGSAGPPIFPQLPQVIRSESIHQPLGNPAESSPVNSSNFLIVSRRSPGCETGDKPLGGFLNRGTPVAPIPIHERACSAASQLRTSGARRIISPCKRPSTAIGQLQCRSVCPFWRTCTIHMAPEDGEHVKECRPHCTRESI